MIQTNGIANVKKSTLYFRKELFYCKLLFQFIGYIKVVQTFPLLMFVFHSIIE